MMVPRFCFLLHFFIGNWTINNQTINGSRLPLSIKLCLMYYVCLILGLFGSCYFSHIVYLVEVFALAWKRKSLQYFSKYTLTEEPQAEILMDSSWINVTQSTIFLVQNEFYLHRIKFETSVLRWKQRALLASTHQIFTHTLVKLRYRFDLIKNPVWHFVLQISIAVFEKSNSGIE